MGPVETDPDDDGSNKADPSPPQKNKHEELMGQVSKSSRSLRHTCAQLLTNHVSMKVTKLRKPTMVALKALGKVGEQLIKKVALLVARRGVAHDIEMNDAIKDAEAFSKKLSKNVHTYCPGCQFI